MMTGAVLSPRPGDNDVVLPDASVPAPPATPEQAR
jgi:hypothetical protein